MGAPLVRDEEPGRVGRHKRFGRKRRERFHRFVERLVEKKLAEPDVDPLLGKLPPSIAASSEKRQKVSALVAKLASAK